MMVEDWTCTALLLLPHPSQNISIMGRTFMRGLGTGACSGSMPLPNYYALPREEEEEEGDPCPHTSLSLWKMAWDETSLPSRTLLPTPPSL